LDINDKKYNLLDKEFGSWKVLSFDKIKGSHGHRYWNCQCKCGNIQSVRASKLINGNSNQCRSCASRKAASKNKAYKNGASKRNGWTNWFNMMKRINTQNRIVCDEWLDANKYLDWIEDKWFPNCQVHRLNNNGIYEPSNCIVITKEEHSKIHYNDGTFKDFIKNTRKKEENENGK